MSRLTPATIRSLNPDVIRLVATGRNIIKLQYKSNISRKSFYVSDMRYDAACHILRERWLRSHGQVRTYYRILLPHTKSAAARIRGSAALRSDRRSMGKSHLAQFSAARTMITASGSLDLRIAISRP